MKRNLVRGHLVMCGGRVRLILSLPDENLFSTDVYDPLKGQNGHQVKYGGKRDPDTGICPDVKLRQ
jgi:hypothetical protein